MTEGFVKLWSSILDSTIWCLDSDTCKIWITMLAMADSKGLVHAAIPGIAARARVSIEATEKALEIFQAPDPHSRSQVNEGRRVEKADRDWRIINFVDHRNRQVEESEKIRKREWWRKNRGKNITSEKLADTSNTSASLAKTSSIHMHIHNKISERDLNSSSLRSEESTGNDSVTVTDLSSSPLIASSLTSVDRRRRKRSVKEISKGSLIWNSYSESYQKRYGTPPIRNAKQNALCAQLVDRLGEDGPAVAAYFVGLPTAYYVAKGHSLACLVMDAEKVRTEWATGNRITSARAREEDRLAASGDAWKNVIEKHRQKEGEK